MTNDILNKVKKDKGLRELISKSTRVGIVGGSVRDLFLGKKSKDIDLIVLGLSINEIIDILKKHNFVDLVGKSFGVIVYRHEDGDMIDIAIPRTERKIGKGHNGFEIRSSKFIKIDDDLKRRDFTFNSMILWMDGTIYDKFDGLGSIKRKTIEMVNKEAFAEDSLRILRAVQFAVRFGFEIDDDILELIKIHKNELLFMSSNRITEELSKFAKGNADFAHGINLLNKLGISDVLFGTKILTNCEIKNSETLFLSILSSIASTGSDAIFNFKDFFNVGNGFKKFVHIIFFSKHKDDIKFAVSLMKHEELVKKTIDFFDDSVKSILLDMIAGKMIKNLKELALHGSDLVELGLRGSEIGQAQRKLFDGVLTNKVKNNKDELINFLNN